MAILHLNDRTWIKTKESVEEVYKLIKEIKKDVNYEPFIKVIACDYEGEEKFIKRYIDVKRIIEIY